MAITNVSPIKVLFRAFHAAGFTNKRQLCADLNWLMTVKPDDAHNAPDLYFWRDNQPRFLSGNWPIQRLKDLLISNLDNESYMALHIAVADVTCTSPNKCRLSATDSVANAIVKISHTRNGDNLCRSICEVLGYSSTLTHDSTVTDMYETCKNKALRSVIRRSTHATVAD